MFKTIATFLALAALAALALMVPGYAAELGGGILAAGFAFPVRGRTLGDLKRLANPDPSVRGTSEAIAWTLYDTQLYVDNVTTQLAFFQTTNVDRSITNMQTGGSLPDPQFFEIYYFGADILQEVTSDVTTDVTPGAWDNVQRLILTSRAFWTFTISDKEYGPWPASLLHGTGGVQGFGFAATTVAATSLANQYGLNGPADGGFCMDGAIVIPPKVGFRLQLNWPAAVQLSGTTDVRIRTVMHGVLHRRVL